MKNKITTLAKKHRKNEVYYAALDYIGYLSNDKKQVNIDYFQRLVTVVNNDNELWKHMIKKRVSKK